MLFSWYFAVNCESSPKVGISNWDWEKYKMGINRQFIFVHKQFILVLNIFILILFDPIFVVWHFALSIWWFEISKETMLIRDKVPLNNIFFINLQNSSFNCIWSPIDIILGKIHLSERSPKQRNIWQTNLVHQSSKYDVTTAAQFLLAIRTRNILWYV